MTAPISKSASESARNLAVALVPPWQAPDGLLWDVNKAAEQIGLTIQSAIDTEIDTEQGRWQETIYNLVTKETGQLHPPPMIDGAGCDSGDPLDFTLSEIQQAIGAWEDHAAKLHTARQKDAEMIVRLMKQADELMTLRDSLTKQVEELRADKARLDWLDGRMIDGVHVEVWAKGDPEVKVEREAVVYLGTCTARASHIRLAIDAAMRCKDTPNNHPHH
jgi:hypothetical protein